MVKRKSVKGKDILKMGIDLSLTATGYCIANRDFDRVTTGVLNTTPKQLLEDRIFYIWNNLRVLAEGNKNSIVEIAVEGLAFAAKGQRLAQISGLYYYITIQAKRHLDIPLRIVPPTKLKQFVTGKGRCEKNLMLMKCFKKWGFEAPDDNICDAYCLTRYCWEVPEHGNSKK